MNTILKGKPVADEILEKIQKDILKFDASPVLAIVRVGDNANDAWYQKFATKRLESLGAEVINKIYQSDITTKEAQEEIQKLSSDDNIHGILLLSHVPAHIDRDLLQDTIHPDKDVDGNTTYNLGKLLKRKEDPFISATPQGVMEILKYYNIELAGKRVLIINRTEIVGKPLALLMVDNDATVEIAHSKTENLEDVLQDKDIVVCSVGIKDFLTGDMLPEGVTVIDVGINEDEEGKMIGDVNWESLKGRNIKATPVPGGVGSVTTAVLASNLIKAYKLQK